MPSTRLAMPVGTELLELVDPLADAAEADRRAGHLFHAERGAAARVAVELRQHDAGEAERSWNALRDLDRVLADHRVDDEKDVLGWTAALIAASSSMSFSSIARRPAVS